MIPIVLEGASHPRAPVRGGDSIAPCEPNGCRWGGAAGAGFDNCGDAASVLQRPRREKGMDEFVTVAWVTPGVQ